MKKIMSFVAIMLSFAALPLMAEMRGGVGEIYLPNTSGQETVVPFLVENFPTGTTNRVTSMDPVLNDIRNKLMSDPNSYGILQGTVSDLHINNGCYVDPSNPAYFSLSSGPQHIVGSNRDETDRLCNSALATSRAWNIRNWLVQQGVPSNRLIIYDFPVESKASDSNFPNQSVAVLIVHSNAPAGGCPGTNCPVPRIEVKVPDNCTENRSEEVVNGTLVIKVNVTCTAPEQSTIPDDDDQTCHWYNQYPCWTKGQKGLFWGAVGVGATAAVLSSTCIVIGGGGGGDNGGGDGGSIRIGGNCK